jgi:hypothetical protein
VFTALTLNPEMTTVSADARTLLAGLIQRALEQVVPTGTAARIHLDRPKQAQHGDFACNIAMLLAKELRGNPRAIAQKILDALPASPDLEKAEIAGTGFINLFLTESYKQQVVGRVLASGSRYGCSNIGQDRKTQVEFVSVTVVAPHTGPAWHRYWQPPAMPYRASTTSMMPAGRWTSSRYRHGCAISNWAVKPSRSRQTPIRVITSGIWRRNCARLTGRSTTGRGHRPPPVQLMSLPIPNAISMI